MSTTDQVLSEFIDAWNAGRRPRVREYLERVPAGSGRDALAEQITTWLAVAPAPALDDEAREGIRRERVVAEVLAAGGSDAGLWPSVVPGLRERAGLSVREVAARIVERLGLRPGDADRTAEYLERLERGELEARRVSRRLLDALGSVLGAAGVTLADAGRFGAALRPAPGGAPLFRAQDAADRQVAEDIAALSRAAFAPAPEAMDEVDRLFLGGPGA